MSVYPSLEDMKVDQLVVAQQCEGFRMAISQQQPDEQGPIEERHSSVMTTTVAYPSLHDFMGLELSEATIVANMPEYVQLHVTQTAVSASGRNSMIAPLSGQSLGLQVAQVNHGIREIILCKGKDAKLGVKLKDINAGIFVCLVTDKSPASLAGLRFGDQILQINGENLAGYDVDKVYRIIKQCPINGIRLAVRDRPFERSLTLHKDSTGHVGFQFKNGKIISLVKDSSAARNGLLIDHYLLEVDGQNVVGLKDKEIVKIIENADPIVTITVIPRFIYEHMVKQMHPSLIKELMDHSMPIL